eukprot:gnl/Spiro4/3028_TR1491_c0_g1_i1.p1 gnl/Spiro4/3028_TR1491_c0_g1~~gnl/Spiro4/3028_TR1491_c0_g1_i1.p1  ORF type:complete len:174 (+),score=43.14 gnl/Spiro4/3028_TR1491_c0_g1_i1:102-623(+)
MSVADVNTTVSAQPDVRSTSLESSFTKSKKTTKVVVVRKPVGGSADEPAALKPAPAADEQDVTQNEAVMVPRGETRGATRHTARTRTVLVATPRVAGTVDVVTTTPIRYTSAGTVLDRSIVGNPSKFMKQAVKNNKCAHLSIDENMNMSALSAHAAAAHVSSPTTSPLPCTLR